MEECQKIASEKCVLLAKYNVMIEVYAPHIKREPFTGEDCSISETHER
jgi:hypothetical protein